MTATATKTKVFFVQDKHGCTAVFPDEPANPGRYVCFDIIGGHGECDRAWASSRRNSTPQEYEATYKTLVNHYEYELDVWRRRFRR